jgi:hypothetical protein
MPTAHLVSQILQDRPDNPRVRSTRHRIPESLCRRALRLRWSCTRLLDAVHAAGINCSRATLDNRLTDLGITLGERSGRHTKHVGLVGRRASPGADLPDFTGHERNTVEMFGRRLAADRDRRTALLHRAQSGHLPSLEALWTQYGCRLPLVEARMASQGVVCWWVR